MDALNKQIEQKTPTFVYLVKGNRKKSTAYRASLIQISKEQPEETALIPEYYAEKELLQYMKAWMKIGQVEPIKMSEMNGF